MNLSVLPGKYILAISGGVDSVALLHCIATQHPQVDFVVAHFDHGIRPDSADDALFVAELAKKYDADFISDRVELGANASENAARTARYDFLRRAQKQVHAQGIITAHHQDDVLETAIFNLMRGTGRRGITALQSTPQIVRPMLGSSKVDIIGYATKLNLSWREDSTNHDERYTRNYIRHRLLVRFDADARQQLLAIINSLTNLNHEIDTELSSLIPETIDRRWFNQLPHAVSREVLAQWLRNHGIRDYDKKTIERLVMACKTKSAGTQLDVRGGTQILILRNSLALSLVER